MTHNAAIRILIVDDHEIIRRGLKMRLNVEPDMNVVGEADDGDTALEQARLLQPDVILMDVQMPKMSGITATHHMISIAPSSAVILLSLSDEDQMRRMAMSAGASAFLTKHSHTDPLINTVRQLSADR